MKTARASLLIVVLIMGIALGACTSKDPRSSSSGSDPGCKPNHHLVCATLIDNGRSVHVRDGQTLRVVLSEAGLTWSALEETGPRLLRPIGAVAQNAGSLTASYKAVRVGRTGLQATGAPKCQAGQACPQFLLLWRLQVVVST
jgi:hypothetical protein